MTLTGGRRTGPAHIASGISIHTFVVPAPGGEEALSSPASLDHVGERLSGAAAMPPAAAMPVGGRRAQGCGFAVTIGSRCRRCCSAGGFQRSREDDAGGVTVAQEARPATSKAAGRRRVGSSLSPRIGGISFIVKSASAVGQNDISISTLIENDRNPGL